MNTIPDGVRTSYGALPDGWRLERMKFSCVVRNSNVDKVIAEGEEAVRLCNYTDVYYNDRITPDLEFKEGSATPAEINRFQLKRGQVIVTKDSESWEDIGIPALVTEDMPDVLCGYHLSVLEPSDTHLDGGYLAWLCRSAPLNNQFKLGANGVTRFGLGQYPMKNAYIALPPPETQRSIAAFLDSKTAQIDALVEKKRALLDRLAEKRQALITRAVTKGLDPSCPLKDSGVDWLGEIPVHWEIKRLRHLAKGPLKYGVNAPAEFDQSDWPRFVRITDIDDLGQLRPETFRSLPPEVADGYLLEEQDILLARSGATVGKSFIYQASWGRACFAGYLIRARLTEEVSPRFVYLMMNSAAYWGWVGSSFIQSTIQNLSAEKYANLWIAIPPTKAEQDRIASSVEEACAGIDMERDLVSRSLELLTEYRSALITSAVTGRDMGFQ